MKSCMKLAVFVVLGLTGYGYAEQPAIIKNSAYCIEHSRQGCLQIKRMLKMECWHMCSSFDFPAGRPICLIGGCDGRLLGEGECFCHDRIEEQLAYKESITTYHDQSGNILEISDVTDRARIELQFYPVYGVIAHSIKGPTALHLYDMTDCPVACLHVPAGLDPQAIAKLHNLRELRVRKSFIEGSPTEVLFRR